MLAVDETSNLYQIGRLFPFYYSVRGSRYIFFGSLGNSHPTDAFVIFMWAFGCVALSLLSGFFEYEQRWHLFNNSPVLGHILGSLSGWFEWKELKSEQKGMRRFTDSKKGKGELEMTEISPEDRKRTDRDRAKKRSHSGGQNSRGEKEKEKEKEDDLIIIEEEMLEEGEEEDYLYEGHWVIARIVNKHNMAVFLLIVTMSVLLMIYAALYLGMCNISYRLGTLTQNIIGCVWDPSSATGSTHILVLNMEQGFNFTNVPPGTSLPSSLPQVSSRYKLIVIVRLSSI